MNAARESITLHVNGAPVVLAACTVEQLLAARGLAGKRVAVERNGAIVPRSLHAQTMLGDGDRLEIVVAVGGG